MDDSFEKLGVFYLGRAGSGEGNVLYDSRDLVTHAVCVGMTGSGKTGLCIGLIEEAALDRVPVIAIDPKGDLTNLLLTFPELRPEDFRPWVNEDDAARAGVPVDQWAAQQAETWRKGLAAWGEDGARIGRLRDAAEFVIYTPGSKAGLPVSILATLAAPPATDDEALADRAATAATSLLALLGVDADPVRSREHILLATILHDAWQAGRSLDLTSLIGAVEQPGLDKVGVMDLETFFPAKDRHDLALAINNLIAAPGFATWLEGTPLDVGALMHTEGGKPRVSVFSIAHLGDAERLFFVSLLLNEMLTWMRAQTGTTSLRALLYMDEIFGFFPPVAEPPTKKPLLTLLKQARAFGLGVVLATQNPVDLDYKGLANAGTWFIGRLQTDNDKERLLDGISGVDRATVDPLIAGLEKRHFLLHNVHEDAPVVFESRWAMSYLRGPLTLPQIETLMDPVRETATASAAAAAPASPPAVTAAPTPPAAAPAGRPALPADLPHWFATTAGSTPTGSTLVYVPMVLGVADVAYGDAPARVAGLAGITPNPIPVDWGQAQVTTLRPEGLAADPAPEAEFLPVAPAALETSSYTAWTRDFEGWVVQTQGATLFKSPSIGLTSQPGESERDFRVRLSQARREGRDDKADKLRQKYAAKLARLEEKLRHAQQAEAREADQAKQAKLQTAISVGATVLTSLLGRKRVSAGSAGRAVTAVRGAGRAAQQQEDVTRAHANVEAVQAEMATLEQEAQAEVAAVAGTTDALTETLDTVTVAPKKTGVEVRLVALTFCPYYRDPSGTFTPAWT